MSVILGAIVKARRSTWILANGQRTPEILLRFSISKDFNQEENAVANCRRCLRVAQRQSFARC